MSRAALATAAATQRRHAKVETVGYQVFGVQLFGRYKFGDGVRGRDFHFIVDATGLDVERATEDAGEGERVVDLIRVVAAAGRHRERAQLRARDSGAISGVGFASAKTIGSGAIDRTMSGVSVSGRLRGR